MFHTRLKVLLKNFNLNEAIAINKELRDYENRGRRVNEETEELWDQVIVLIEATQKRAV
jgi:hypothetical protein